MTTKFFKHNYLSFTSLPIVQITGQSQEKNTIKRCNKNHMLEQYTVYFYMNIIHSSVDQRRK